jgi:hypothetical protein
MTFEEWYLQSGWAVKYIMEVAWNASRRNTIVEIYGEAAADLVLESLSKAPSSPVAAFSEAGQGVGSQTTVAEAVNPCSGCAKVEYSQCSYRCKY